MPSRVLRSRRSVKDNIAIMRTFVRLRELLASHSELARKLDELERYYDKHFQVVSEAIRQLTGPEASDQERPFEFTSAGRKEEHAQG